MRLDIFIICCSELTHLTLEYWSSRKKSGSSFAVAHRLRYEKSDFPQKDFNALAHLWFNVYFLPEFITICFLN